MTDNEFSLLLENWVRWSRSRRPQRRTISLEGNWRSPQPWDALPITHVPVDKLAGQEVEDAWASMRSTRHKLLLKWHYIYLRTVGGIIRSLRLHGYRLQPVDYDIEITRATLMLKDALDIKKKHAHDSLHNSEPGRDDRPLALCGGRTAPERNVADPAAA